MFAMYWLNSVGAAGSSASTARLPAGEYEIAEMRISFLEAPVMSSNAASIDSTSSRVNTEGSESACTALVGADSAAFAVSSDDPHAASAGSSASAPNAETSLFITAVPPQSTQFR